MSSPNEPTLQPANEPIFWLSRLAPTAIPQPHARLDPACWSSRGRRLPLWYTRGPWSRMVSRTVK